MFSQAKNFAGEMKNKGYAKFGGVNKVHNGSVQVAYSLRLCMYDKCWGCLCETLTDML